jgi:hypothetical protein
VASLNAVKAFLARAGDGPLGSFSATYAVAVPNGGSGLVRTEVFAAQRTRAVVTYREDRRFSPDEGRAASASYEVFAAAGTVNDATGLTNAGPGVYSCTRPTGSGQWTCTGPFRGIGMGVTSELLGPYPPQDLALGLSNAAYYYLPALGYDPSAPSSHRAAAYIFDRRARGQKIGCLGFGTNGHLFGGACLEPDGLVGYYDLPTQATDSVYEVATLLGYTPAVEPSALALPAAPHPAPGL